MIAGFVLKAAKSRSTENLLMWKPLNNHISYLTLPPPLSESREVTVIPESLDVRSEDFEAWLKAETSGIMDPLNADARKLVDRIVQRLQDFRDVCEKLVQEAEREEKRGRAVRKARVTGKLARFFLKQVDKVAFPDEMSTKNLNRFHDDLEKALRSTEREKNVWFPRISPLFIITRKRIDFAYARLTAAVSEMKPFLSESYLKAEKIEETFLGSDRITELLAELSRNIQSVEVAETKLQSIQKKMSAGERELNAIENSAELGDLVEVNQNIQRLRKQAKHELRHLRKPFKKLLNLVRGSSLSLSSEETEKLGQLVENPYVALATEKQGQPTIRSLLTKMERAIEKGVLELKTSRLRKAQEDISAVLNGQALDSLQSSCAHAFLRSRNLSSSEKTKAAERRTRMLKIKLGQLKMQNESSTSRLRRLKAEQKLLQKKIVEQKETLEETISSILQRDIKIQL
jgi:predicted  nucleic acid-binding Zn-ribbon protein